MRGLFILLPLSCALGGCSEEPARSAGSGIAAGPGFSLKGTEDLRPTPDSGKGGVLMFSTDGSTPWEPQLAAARSTSEVSADDRRSFALQRVMQMPQARFTDMVTTSPMTVDGLDGFETIAKGAHPDSSSELRIYQAILFEDDGYILIQGRVGEHLAGQYEPQFMEIARSLVRSRR